MKTRRRSLVLGAVLLAGVPAAAVAGPLCAGAAQVDITPPLAMFPLTSGQTFGSVHDPLFARALVLDDGVDRAVLVSADVTELPNGGELLDAVSGALDITRERIILSATHDHNAPTGGVRPNSRFTHPYFAVFKAGIVAAARNAAARMRPAEIGYRTGRAYVNTNRDEKIGAAYHMGYAPEGPSDKTVAVVTVRGTHGKPIAVCANYAVHGVVIYQAKTKAGQVQITRDFLGATAAYVEDRIPGTVALWTSGAAGNQNPLIMATYNQDAPDVVDEGAAGWAIFDVQAGRLSEEIVRVSRDRKPVARDDLVGRGDRRLLPRAPPRHPCRESREAAIVRRRAS